ncbi:MAG: LiaF-related protein [Gemmatimonadota bacterium]|jgi:hypothetical protein
MTTDGQGLGGSLNQTRQVTIDALCEHFANDAMSVEDFEARVDVAHRATSVEELRKLLSDLPSGNLPAVPGSSASPTRVGTNPVVPREHVKETGYAIAILGGSRRTGRWTPAHITHTITIMGGAELDFREAALPSGVTELKVYALMGGVEVIVPPGLNVESHGIGILGGFDHAGDEELRPEAGAPTLRVSGVAIMGGVDIKVRHPGESARDARRRRRQERRDRRRELRDRMKELKSDIRRGLKD